MNVAAPMVASMSSLFTPTVLFCVLNLMIGVIFFTSRLKHKKQEHHPQYSGQDTVNSPHHAPLVRVPSLLDRVKSFNFSSHRSEQPNPFYPTTQVHSNPHHEQEQNVEEMDHAMMTRSKSETTHADRAPEGRMKKSASEKAVVVKQQLEEEVERQRPATMREREGSWSRTTRTSFAEDEAVDKKADDFINRFRQQLKLQRLDSLLRYKEMLNRGVRG